MKKRGRGFYMYMKPFHVTEQTMTDPISTHNLITDTCPGDMRPDVADAARELGLKPVRAWVTDEKKKSGTVGAERVRRSRAKGEELGLKQLSITAPIELHPMLKTLAARTKAGEPVNAVLAELVPQSGSASLDSAKERSDFFAAWLDTLPAWRRWVLRLLLPTGVTRCR